MSRSPLWCFLFIQISFISGFWNHFNRFDIAISCSNRTSTLSTSIFNFSVVNYCVGGLPVLNGHRFEYHKEYSGELFRLSSHRKLARNQNKNDSCFPPQLFLLPQSPWIAIIIENEEKAANCSSLALVNYTVTSTNATAVLFLHSGQSQFNWAGKDVDLRSNSPSMGVRRQISQLLTRSRSSASPRPAVFISLPIDMFPDLPSQLDAAQGSPAGVIAMTGWIRFFIEPPPQNGQTVTDTTTAVDLSSSLLLLIIVFVLFLLLAVLFVPARLGLCFWQRFCFASIVYSDKKRRSRKLTAATKKALKQLPVKHLDQVDPLLSQGFDQCAICIELFRSHDLIRSLPCRHMYHRACIDPWLLKHRSCPLCKQNILIACGLVPMAEEDLMDTCSASERNSEFSSTFHSRRPSNFSYTSENAASNLASRFFCFDLSSFFNLSRHRHGRTHYRMRRGSSLNDEDAEFLPGRRVLGSASENSSSSIVAAFGLRPTYPSVEAANHPPSTPSQSLLAKTPGTDGWYHPNLLCCCIPVEGVVMRDAGVNPLPVNDRNCAPSLHAPVQPQPTMLFYQLSCGNAFTPTPVDKLPSYEQVAGKDNRPALPTLIPTPSQHILNWERRLINCNGDLGFTAPALQGHGDYQHRIPLVHHQQQQHSNTTTNVVYAVLSTPNTRTSVDESLPSCHLCCPRSFHNHQLPLYVSRTPESSDIFVGKNLVATSPPDLSLPRHLQGAISVERSKPTMSTPAKTIRQAARFLVSGLSSTHLLPGMPRVSDGARGKPETSKSSYYDRLKHHHSHRRFVSVSSSKIATAFPLRVLGTRFRCKKTTSDRPRRHRNHQAFDVDDRGGGGGGGSGSSRVASAGFSESERRHASVGKTLVLGADGAILRVESSAPVLFDASLAERTQRRFRDRLLLTDEEEEKAVRADTEIGCVQQQQHPRVRSVRVTVEPHVMQCHTNDPNDSIVNEPNAARGGMKEKINTPARPSSLPISFPISTSATPCPSSMAVTRPSSGSTPVIYSFCHNPDNQASRLS